MHEEKKNDRWENEYDDLLVFSLEQNRLNEKGFYACFEWLTMTMVYCSMVIVLQRTKEIMRSNHQIIHLVQIQIHTKTKPRDR